MPVLLFLISGETLRLVCIYLFFFLNMNLDRKYSGINIKLEGIFRVIPYVSSISCTIFSRDANCFCGKKHKVRT